MLNEKFLEQILEVDTVVHCDSENSALIFLEKMDCLGYNWDKYYCTNKKNSKYKDYGETICYNVYLDKTICCSNRKFYERSNSTIIEFNSNPYLIEIL